jgi:hypothetical protein
MRAGALPSLGPRVGFVDSVLVELLVRICARVPFRPGGPYPRHPEEMVLQSRVMNVAQQLHAVSRQAHALKRMPSQVVRLGHSAPSLKHPQSNCTLHGVACPVGGLRHRKI